MPYQARDVSFENKGETLVGKLFVPARPGPHAAVAIVGPVGFVKEQAPLQYASRLARLGIAALIFDPRYHGASSGEPRRHESGAAKAEDLQAALAFLSKQDGIDTKRLGILGICQGVNWAVEAAVNDDRATALGLVAGHYLTPATARMYLGDDETIEARMKRSADAQKAFETTGEVRYIPITGSEDALLTHQAPADWYAPWGGRKPWFRHRGAWENRITAMSEALIWGWRTDHAMARLKIPVMMVHGDKAATGPRIPKELFDSIATDAKALHWIDDANQLQFYEDPLVIDTAVDALFAHFDAAR